MRFIAFLSIFLIYSTSYAQDINSRLRLSKKIMEVYQVSCRGESNAIKEAFTLAATYITHGEYNNMRQQLLEARAISTKSDCQKSIDNLLD
ncbi:MAG: hypothetical protein GY744_12200 [Gammaproteobacteria bacterium]|nr:hypothetical protein [Gammaproteobacteria bacterium]